MRSDARCIATLLKALLSMAASGCQPYLMPSSAVDAYPKADQELDFLAEVEKMNAITNNDAVHAFLLLQDGADAQPDYAARRAEAIRRGWMDRGASTNANEAARVGWMATAGCMVMQIKGGVSMHLFGPVPRYAVRELIFMEILPLRTENQVLSGSEFVDYLNRLDRISGRGRRASAASPLGTPAGESAASPGNEAAIQEGPLPEQGPLEVPAVPPDSSAAPVPVSPQSLQPSPPAAEPASKEPATPSPAHPVPKEPPAFGGAPR